MPISEFRKDLVSGEWVLIASGRAKRTKPSEDEKKKRVFQSKDTCPFEDPQASGNGDPILAYNNGKVVTDISGGWTTQVIQNKYPAVVRGVCGEVRRVGPFLTHAAHGFHEIIITRDHERTFAQFTDDETTEVFRLFRDRYQKISNDECGAYISIFHNWGASAGASVTHSHSQIISTPVIPPEVIGSIEGANRFYQQEGTSVHMRMLAWEINEDKRIIFENEHFIALCPYVSKTPYEVRVFPKQHRAHFEKSTDEELIDCSKVLNIVLRAIHDVLGDPDLNFYIHTTPVAKDASLNYEYYQWHIEIVPRVSVAAGFELGTAVYINVMDPDEAAEKLRSAIQ